MDPLQGQPAQNQNQQNQRQTLKNRVQGKQDFIVRWLQDFYNQPGRLEEVLPILTGSSPVSLRLIDWFVTNYSKKFNVSYPLAEETGTKQFMVHFHYKRELKAYSKRLFDPFCRRERISFQIRGQAPIEETTVGQLNFFRWFIEKEILEYVLEHKEAIETDMNKAMKEQNKARNSTATSTESSTSVVSTTSLVTTSTASSARSTRRRQAEKEQPAAKQMQKHLMEIELRFD
jgi:hypothetical protein